MLRLIIQARRATVVHQLNMQMEKAHVSDVTKTANVCLMTSDTENETSGSDEELDDWIEHVKRSTRESEENEDIHYFMLARDTAETEMETCHETCCTQ